MSLNKASLDIVAIQNQFPALNQSVNGKKLFYLDSAATSLKPQVVIDRVTQFLKFETANVHRGAHYLSDRATTYFEQARKTVQTFIKAKATEEIIFTKGTTESINLVAQTLKNRFKKGDEILISEMEHHANIVPWQMIAEEKSLVIQVIKVLDNGQLDWNDFESKMSSKVKLVAITQCSNTLGTINNVDKIVEIAHKFGALVLIDGAQSVTQLDINVQKMNCDFFVFSGHKIFAPFGIGILYGRKEILETLPPYQGGGSMISQVSFEKTTYNEIPFRFEAGTPNIEGAIGLAEALNFVESLGHQNIFDYEQSLLKYAEQKLLEIPDLHIVGRSPKKAAIISFNIKGINHSDLGQILDQQGIAVRVGHHCTQPLMKRFGITGTVRASFSIFNTMAEIDQLIVALKKAKEILL
jgi:cysteine desulfurase/selenocysteine lyase